MRYLFLFIFLSCIYIFYEGLKKDPKEIPSNLISQKIPSFSLTSFSGTNFTDLDLKKNEVIILNFFASWCPPCSIEHKFLTKLGRTVSIYGIAKKNEHNELSSWLNKLGNPYTKIGMDYEGITSIDWGVYGLPETFIIDKDGYIKYKHVGPILERDMKKIKSIIKNLK